MVPIISIYLPICYLEIFLFFETTDQQIMHMKFLLIFLYCQHLDFAHSCLLLQASCIICSQFLLFGNLCYYSGLGCIWKAKLDLSGV